MNGRADRAELSRRLARLPPEKRELFRKLVAGEVSEIQRPALGITRETVQGVPGEAHDQRLYDRVNETLDRTPFASAAVFLNFGYVASDRPRVSPIRLPERCLNRNSIQLALEVVADVDLGGRDVVDVGCGRGGTISVMTTYFTPRRVLGVDLSAPAVQFCQRRHVLENVRFVRGDAQSLPLASARFDVLTSIESASGYPDIAKFYAEAARVLRPGGHFLYADAMTSGRVAERRAQLAAVSLQIESERDITPNVLLSCAEAARVHRAALGAGHDEAILGDFLGLPGSGIHERLTSGELVYLIFKARRSAA